MSRQNVELLINTAASYHFKEILDIQSWRFWYDKDGYQFHYARSDNNGYGVALKEVHDVQELWLNLKDSL